MYMNKIKVSIEGKLDDSMKGWGELAEGFCQMALSFAEWYAKFVFFSSNELIVVQKDL